MISKIIRRYTRTGSVSTGVPNRSRHCVCCKKRRGQTAQQEGRNLPLMEKSREEWWKHFYRHNADYSSKPAFNYLCTILRSYSHNLKWLFVHKWVRNNKRPYYLFSLERVQWHFRIGLFHLYVQTTGSWAKTPIHVGLSGPNPRFLGSDGWANCQKM